MKEKVMVAVILTVILIGTMHTIVPVLGEPEPIKIGIIGPITGGLPHWDPAGMKPGAEIAVKEINDAGGVNVSGTYRNITLFFEDEHALPTPDPGAAQQAIQNLYDAGCRIIVGGFRTEVTGPMIEHAMSRPEPVIFIINGAATNALIAGTVPVDYDKYKYLFRVNPVNDTMLLKTIVGSLSTLIVKMLPIFGCYNAELNRTQLKYAVLVEQLTWTQTMYNYFSNASIYPGLLGPNVNCTYAAQAPEGTMDFSSYIGGIIANKARIVIHIFSGRAGVYFSAAWGTAQVKAVPVGINVLGQLQTHWSSTFGKCEYESILNFVGTRTPITPEAVDFWDDFVAYKGVWPIYTAFGAYNAIRLLKEAIEAAGTTDADSLVSALEAIDTTSLTGKFKFTGAWNATHNGNLHDVFCTSYGPTWPSPQYTRALMCQWHSGRMEVVCPMGQPYSKDWCFPPWMYPYRTDINYDTKVDIEDIFTAAIAFGSYPGHPTWDQRTDVNDDNKIDIEDIFTIALNFGLQYSVPLWCDG